MFSNDDPGSIKQLSIQSQTIHSTSTICLNFIAKMTREIIISNLRLRIISFLSTRMNNGKSSSMKTKCIKLSKNRTRSLSSEKFIFQFAQYIFQKKLLISHCLMKEFITYYYSIIHEIRFSIISLSSFINIKISLNWIYEMMLKKLSSSIISS